MIQHDAVYVISYVTF